jgi:transposase
MQVLYTHCAGLDIHKKSVVACRLRLGPDGAPEQETRTFGTMTEDLLALLDWLLAGNCTHVAMESTGNYWKPVYNILEGNLEILLVNAQHCRNVPGRKTDVKDAEWLVDLLRHGLLKASFVPDRPQRDLRDLTRGRSLLVAERARWLNRLQGLLEGANIKLASVVSQIQGVSARAMLEALAAGHTDPETLAALAKGKLREKRDELCKALDGLVREHHRFLLAQHLTQLDFYEEQIRCYSTQIEGQLRTLSEPPAGAPPPPGSAGSGDPGGCARSARRGLPPETPPTYEEAVVLLDTIPGIAERVSEAILAETGVDMGRFGYQPGRLTRWAGVAPGNHVSAGKRFSGKVTPGNAALRRALIQAAHGAARTKDCYFNTLYHRIAGRRGKKRALVAVARSVLVAVFHVLLYHEPYRELGGNYVDERKKESVVNHLLHRLQKLGYQASLQTVAA